MPQRSHASRWKRLCVRGRGTDRSPQLDDGSRGPVWLGAGVTVTRALGLSLPPSLSQPLSLEIRNRGVRERTWTRRPWTKRKD